MARWQQASLAVRRQARCLGNTLECTHSGFQALFSMARRSILRYRIMKLVRNALNLNLRDCVLRKNPKLLYASLPRASNEVSKVHFIVPSCLKALRKPPTGNLARQAGPRQGVPDSGGSSPTHSILGSPDEWKSLTFSWNGWMLVHNCR